jgi:hypothetical protein
MFHQNNCFLGAVHHFGFCSGMVKVFDYRLLRPSLKNRDGVKTKKELQNGGFCGILSISFDWFDHNDLGTS